MNQKNTSHFKATPWDSIIFGMDTYEISTLSQDILKEVLQTPGHYTIKIDPLNSKKILHEYGFYYCDTLLEPYCDQDHFIYFENKNAVANRETTLINLLNTCQNSFVYGRFHRDFNIERAWSEQRYINWIKQLAESNCVYELSYDQAMAGFIAIDNNKLVLHALNETFRGKGLSKYFWSKACKDLFARGINEITSSVSAANLAVVNLYASLGFRFRNAVDVYHRLVP